MGAAVQVLEQLRIAERPAADSDRQNLMAVRALHVRGVRSVVHRGGAAGTGVTDGCRPGQPRVGNVADARMYVNKCWIGASVRCTFANRQMHDDRETPRERPKTAHKPTLKTRLILFRRQIAMLDHLMVAIRLRHRATVDRTHIIQAIITAAMRSGLSADDYALLE